jgi:hypothetical protein
MLNTCIRTSPTNALNPTNRSTSIATAIQRALRILCNSYELVTIIIYASFYTIEEFREGGYREW